MNRIYRLIWNRTLNAYVVGSELTAAQGKRAGANALLPPGTVTLAGIGGLLALALAGPAQATDARLDDLQALVAKYSQNDAQNILSTVLPAPGAQLQAGAALSVQLPSANVHVAVPVQAKLQVSPSRVSVGASAGAHAAVAKRPVVSASTSALATVAAAAGSIQAGAAGGIGLQLGSAQGGGSIHGGLLGLGTVVLPGKEEGGNPVRAVAGATVSAVEELTGGLLQGSGIGALVDGVVNGAKPVIDGTGHAAATVASGLTGSAALGTGLQTTVVTATGGLQHTTGALAQGQVVGATQNALATVDGTLTSALHGVSSVVGGVAGSASGVAGLTGTVGSVTHGVIGGTSQLIGSLGATGGAGGSGAGLGGLGQVIGGLTGGLSGGAAGGVGGGLVAAVGKPVDGIVTGVAPVLNGSGQALGQVVGGVTGSASLGAGINGTVGTLSGGLQHTSGALVQGDLHAATGNLVGTVGGTVSALVGTVAGAAGQAGNGGAGLGGLGQVIGGLTGGLTGGAAGGVGGGLVAAVGKPVDGIVTGVAPVLNGSGQALGQVVGGVTGSAGLGAGINNTVGTLSGGLQHTSGALAQGDLHAATGNLVGTAGGTVSALVGTVAGAAGQAGNGGAGLGGLGQVIGGLTGGLTGGAAGGIGGDLVAAVGKPVDGIVTGVAPVLNGSGQALGQVVGGVTGSAGLGAGINNTVGTLSGGLQHTSGALAQGDLHAATGNLVGTVGGTVSALVGTVGGAAGGSGNGGSGAGLGGLGNVVGGLAGSVTGLLGQLGGNGSTTPSSPGQVLTGGVGAVVGAAGNVVAQTGVGNVVDGVVDGTAPVINGLGTTVGGLVGGVTGSGTLGNGVSGTVTALTGGLQNTTGALAQGNLTGTVQNALGTVNNTVNTLLGAVGGTLGGATGSASGVTGLTNLLGGVTGGLTNGLSNVVGQLTGAPAAAPGAPGTPGTPGTPGVPPPAGPGGLVVGNGGLVGTVGQLIGPTTGALFGGNGYTQNGNLTINNANFAQAYSTIQVAGLPVVNLSPVGKLLDGAGNAITGGNSHLTLIGGVTSDSYITNINNGEAGGLLGLLFPNKAPDWAPDCLNLLGLVGNKCWSVPAAQDYQVLIGDGAYANGSKEVVIGTNARHELAQQTASQVFVDANGVKTGVPTADYDARLGQSVVIGDSAQGSANAQTLLGAGATSNKANSVAVGYKSNAERGGLDNYNAFGMSAGQTSIGEVAVGSAGRERQITHVAAGSQATDAVNLAQLQGAINLIGGVSQSAVLYDEDSSGNTNYSHVTLGSGNAANGTVLSNLAAGQLSATSTEAVNGAQVFGIGQALATHLGGGASFSLAGVLSAPSYTLNEIGANHQVSSGVFGNIGAAFSSISQSLYNLSLNTSVNPVNNLLAVQYTADGSGNPTNVVTLTGDGSGAAVAVRNVADGSVTAGSHDAVNGGQLASTNQAVANVIGGTMSYDNSTGQWTGATFKVTAINSGGGTSQQTFGNVTDAFAAMDSSIVNINNRIDNIQNGGAGNAYFAVNSTKPAASATGQDSVAAGPQSSASGEQAVAVGNGANASAANSVALGAGSVADRANTVSVGAAGAERQITHVADGSQATDAVNLRQLQASQEGTVRYDQNADGSTNYASVTMGKAGTSTVVHNVATGVAPTDAVNVAQLNKGLGDVMDWSKDYTDQRFNSVGRDIKRVDDRASAGIASAMAMAGLPQPTEAGKRMASFAASTFHGESSMAVGVSGVSDGGRWIYKLSGSANTRGDGGVTVGAGFQW